MSKAKKWSPPGSGSRGQSYIHIDERKPCRLTPDEGPFEDNEDYPVGTHDSTEEMSVHHLPTHHEPSSQPLCFICIPSTV